MKEGIHPEYHDATVKCACGEEYVVGSTVKEIRLEVCSKCHPFFTGKHKYVDTAGRVDKFFRKYGDNVEPRKKKKKKKRIKALETGQEEIMETSEEVPETAEAAAEEAPAVEETAHTEEAAPVEETPAADESAAEAAPPEEPAQEAAPAEEQEAPAEETETKDA